jgi:hypothetical protein
MSQSPVPFDPQSSAFLEGKKEKQKRIRMKWPEAFPKADTS